LPATPDELVYAWSRSMTKTSVSVPLTPAFGLPLEPKASLGGMTASTLLPTFSPMIAFSSPGITWPTNSVGEPVVYVLPSSLCVVPLQS